jgi:hypothetical protein
MVDTSSASEDANPVVALGELHKALMKHRLMFLFFARARRKNPLISIGLDEAVEYDVNKGIPVEEMDDDGEFLFAYRDNLEQFAQVAVGEFGPDEGYIPTVVNALGKEESVEGATLPYWTVDESACMFLESSAEAIEDMLVSLSNRDAGGRLNDLFQKVRSALRNGEMLKWQACVRVRWSYLATLDDALHELHSAEISLSTNGWSGFRTDHETENGGSQADDAAHRDDEVGVIEPPQPRNWSDERVKWLAEAMMMVQKHPDWSDAKIARQVGRHRSTLSRCEPYQAAAAMARGAREDRHRGHISFDRGSDLRNVEAYTDDSSECDGND